MSSDKTAKMSTEYENQKSKSAVEGFILTNYEKKILITEKFNKVYLQFVKNIKALKHLAENRYFNLSAPMLRFKK